MEFAGPLLRGRLLKRYKRFLADVELDSGETVTAACPNTGSMHGLCDAGMIVHLSKSDNPSRKYAHSWELVEKPGIGLVGINTARPNAIVEQAILQGQVRGLDSFQRLRREVKYGRNSRIDILLEHENGLNCYVEVKNVTLIRKPELAEFPDCVTERGLKHLEELSDMVKLGHRAVMVYLIQCSSPQAFTMAHDLDPSYAKAYVRARSAGVEAVALTCTMSTKNILYQKAVPIIE